jgi:hypothetical protein
LERALSRPQNTEVNAAGAPQDGEKLLKDIDFYARGYRFAEIVTKLNEFEGDPPGCKRAALIVVSQASLNLLTEIEADLSKGAVDLPLTLKDGTAIVSLVMKDERLYSKQQNGQVREIRWVDLATDQIIKLNAELIKKLDNDTDRTRRNESVIALDWLSGDRMRAVASAESLSEKSESFRKRWQVISPGLPD